MSSTGIKLITALFNAFTCPAILIFGIIIPTPSTRKKKIVLLVLFCGIIIFVLDVYKIFFLNT